jgi:thioredoxin-related protein
VFTLALAALLAQDAIEWEKDHAAALAKASSSGKLALVVFRADWCGFCKKMDAETWPAVVKAMKGFVAVRIDADANETLWKERYKGTGLPTAIIVTPEGVAVGRIQGFREAKEFEEILKALPDRVARLKKAQAAHDAAKEESAAVEELGLARQALEDAVGACDAFERVVTLLDGREGLGPEEKLRVARSAAAGAMIKAEEERWAEVTKYVAVFDKRDPENRTGAGDALVAMAAFAEFFGNKNPDAALKIVREGQKKYAASKRLDQMMFLEGAILNEKGEREAATSVWKKVAERFPESDWGKKARAAVEK